MSKDLIAIAEVVYRTMRRRGFSHQFAFRKALEAALALAKD